MKKLKFKLIHILLLVFCIIAFAFGSGCIRSFEDESNYNIKGMDISADRIGNAYVDLNITTYVRSIMEIRQKIPLFSLKPIALEVDC